MARQSKKTALKRPNETASKEVGAVGFYRAFEDRFRGARETIKKRVEVYLPFVLPLLKVHDKQNALDLGCGRGEWLELLQENGFEALGVDLDQGMLQACHERGLPVTQAEAVSYLKTMDDESCSIISGFHIAEHIPFEALGELVAEALRVLRPGGLLILETPNPENLVVGTSGFYMDPTHRQPLPPQLLCFLPEYYGFENTKILRLQEPVDLTARKNITLLDVLGGVSPDYAVVAQKKAELEVMRHFKDAFKRDYGVKLDDLTQAYNDHIEGLKQNQNDMSSQMEELSMQAASDRTRLELLQSQLEQAEVQSRQLREEAKKVEVLRSELKELTVQAASDRTRLELLQPQLEQAEVQSRHFREEAKKVEVLQSELKELTVQAASERERMDQLTQLCLEKDQELKSKQSQLQQQITHSQWLQNEWDAAKAKVDELNHSSHHWWTVADGLERELKAVYKSKSWLVTWPLRKLVKFVKWLLCIPFKLVFWICRLPKRATRLLLVKAMKLALSRPVLKAYCFSRLKKSPRLELKIRALAQAEGLTSVTQPVVAQLFSTLDGSSVPIGDTGDSPCEVLGQEAEAAEDNDSNLPNAVLSLSPRAKAFYIDLLKLDTNTAAKEEM